MQIDLGPLCKIPIEPYTEEQLAEIVQSLDVNQRNDKQTSDLQQAGRLYLLLYRSDPRTKGENAPTIHPTREQQAAALNRLKFALRDLVNDPADENLQQKVAAAFENPGLVFTSLFGRHRNADPTDPVELERLAQVAEEAIDEIPSTAHEPKIARYRFFLELAQIYEAATGKPPGRAGPFKRFACAALEPLNPHATTTVDRDLRRAVEAHKRGQKKHSDS